MAPTMRSRISPFTIWLPFAFFAQAASSEPRVLDCISAFPAVTNHEALATRFGPENVRTSDIEIGEGMYERGTTIHGESDSDRIEILWKDPLNKQRPSVVRILGDHSHWKTDHGLSLGDDLISVQRLNARPFSLSGFGWDYGGTQISWAGGDLEGPSWAPCEVRVRLRLEYSQDSEEQRNLLVLQVLGDGELMSDDPVLQALSPRISSIWLDYGE